jgi:glycosyltransferase involved in cell wall biosynthesis
MKNIVSISKTTVSIGIPAYNEEANIGRLLGDLLSQKCRGFKIAEIIVSSDGSKDATEKIVRTFRDSRIRLITNKERKGIARGLNQLTSQAIGDILVTIDADVRILDGNFIEKLIEPIVRGRADLTSAAIKPLPPKSSFAKMLATSMGLKSALFDVIDGGNSIYTCYGLARAFSAKFYKTLNFPVSVGNDMYSYLECVSRGLKFRFVPESVAWYSLPENLEDHKKQSLRFFTALAQQEKIFAPEFVKSQLKIPFNVYLKAFFAAVPILARYPIRSLMYFLIQFSMRFKSTPESVQRHTWDVALSSKKF